nr:dehydration-responsive element-binding protein 1B-like [Tanacetum cinerariifolium]
METMEDDSSSSTSSSSSQTETRAKNLPKRKAGRKKFKETRHQVYRGVRLRNGSKWVCEVREPSKKTRIWLGTFPTPQMAARAYDAATLTLRGDEAPLNFSDSARLIRRAKSCSARDIQDAALEAALAFRPQHINEMPSTSSPFIIAEGDDKMVLDTGFVDEEALFNMPGFYNNLAEGLVITPPGMKKGFDWNDDTEPNIDLNLWTY